MPFRDRSDAGRKLAKRLRKYADCAGCVILGLPRGGVPVAYEVAHALHLPLDVFLVRKLGVPGHEELAMGAIASGGVKVLNDNVVRSLRISPEDIAKETAKQQEELERREREYREGRPALAVAGKTVILIDDGLATGASMKAAIIALRQRRARRILAAVPVASPRTCEAIGELADEIVCLETPEDFYSVGEWYQDFFQTTDQEARAMLAKTAAEQPVPAAGE
ncbi:MAG TPA: phosphoribosyltransferase [Bryobacteraceae bacterium]|nr:phosphoribosyltransferase [Bryobacteraceae bacterium]